MVRFSCFNAHIHYHKTKKTVQPPIVTMQRMLQDCSQIHPQKESLGTESVDESQMNRNTGGLKTSPFIDCGWKSEETKVKFSSESDMKSCQAGRIKKSQSLGSALHLHSKVYHDGMEDETEEGFSYDGSYSNEVGAPDGSNRCVMNPASESLQVSSGPINNKPIFVIEEQVHPEKESPDDSDTLLSGERVGAYGDRMPSPSRAIVKSPSLPNIGSPPTRKFVAPECRSSDDLRALETRLRESVEQKVQEQVMPEQTKDDKRWRTEKNIVDDGYNSYNYAGSAKDWIMPVADEARSVKLLTGESSISHWEQAPTKDFKIKRIEEWVTDLQYCDPLEEPSELDSYDDQVTTESIFPSALTDTKVDGKVTPGMEAAKRCISSLSPSTTTAQLANHGLVVIPFLSAFVSLKVLNLSGNAIVKITAGALPRGLHMLNLSRNYISTIEGLRELTRLRVLDLSYNKILRIGHGLASCSSLKELYLAGNKISEVEGLHRLLKLTVLDLRFNKISTAKCLGQLASNFNSLQAISLEGNPAQKNVGDEQLKKNLQGLLPNLVYYNRQPAKVNALKDTTDRSVRVGQSDRGLSKGTRKSVQGSHKPALSTHGRKSQAVLSPKPSRSRHGRLPPNPTGTKAVVQRNNFVDSSYKIQNFKSELAIRRSRSEGTLGAL